MHPLINKYARHVLCGRLGVCMRVCCPSVVLTRLADKLHNGPTETPSCSALFLTDISSIPPWAGNPLSIGGLQWPQWGKLPADNVHSSVCLCCWYKVCWIVLKNTERKKKEKDNIRLPSSGVNNEAGAMMKQSTVGKMHRIDTHVKTRHFTWQTKQSHFSRPVWKFATAW